jgi:hypothetical protein
LREELTGLSVHFRIRASPRLDGDLVQGSLGPGQLCPQWGQQSTADLLCSLLSVLRHVKSLRRFSMGKGGVAVELQAGGRRTGGESFSGKGRGLVKKGNGPPGVAQLPHQPAFGVAFSEREHCLGWAREKNVLQVCAHQL